MFRSTNISLQKSNTNECKIRRGVLGNFLDVKCIHIIYYIACACLIASDLIDETQFSSILGLPRNLISNAIYYVSIILYIVCLLRQTITVKRVMIWSILFAVYAYSAYTCGEDYLLIAFLAISASAGFDTRKINRIALYIYIPISLLTIMFSLGGVIESTYMNYGGVINARSSLGFSHPNQLGRVFSVICIAVMVETLNRRSLGSTIVTVVLTVASVLFVMGVAVSRTTGLILLLSLAAYIVIKLTRIGSRPLALASLLALLGVVVTSVLIMIVQPVFFDQFDSMVSGRISLMQGYYSFYGVPLFGRSDFFALGLGGRTHTGVFNYFVVDNAYAHILLREGLIPSLLFLGSIVFVYLRAFCKNIYPPMLFGLACFCVMGLTETYLFRIDINLYLFVIPLFIYESKRGSNYE